MSRIYRERNQPKHPRASASGCVYEHVLIAERALGHCLPDGAEIHHADGDTRNNANRNLVICQDKAYHKLLHYRAKVRRLGGNPNTDKWCGDCQRVRPFEAFNIMRANKSNGRQSICRDCGRVRDEKKRAKHKAVAA